MGVSVSVNYNYRYGFYVKTSKWHWDAFVQPRIVIVQWTMTVQFASLQFMLLNHKNHARRTSLLIVKPLRFTIEWTGDEIWPGPS